VDECGVALELFTAMGLKAGVAHTLKALGDIQRLARQPQASLAFYVRAAAVFAELDDETGLAYTCNGAARTHVGIGNGVVAAELYSRANTYFSLKGIALGMRQAVAGTNRLRDRGMLTARQVRELSAWALEVNGKKMPRLSLVTGENATAVHDAPQPTLLAHGTGRAALLACSVMIACSRSAP
jgi:hypothetical protein